MSLRASFEGLKADPIVEEGASAPDEPEVSFRNCPEVQPTSGNAAKTIRLLINLKFSLSFILPPWKTTSSQRLLRKAMSANNDGRPAAPRQQENLRIFL